ncbi:MAG: DUF3168 domain-containing protein [Xanthomonadales bacterium]|nr:DUF3168 domain-containing protein [Xanthomonadales bacterium]
MTFPVFALISDSSAVKALIGSSPVRFWRDFYPKSAGTPQLPYCVWAVVGGAPENYLSETPGIDSGRVQVDVWAQTPASADAVMAAVRDAIESSAHMISTPISRYDEETDSYGYILEFQFWTSR